jgi:Cu-Zn family superoxide dismutase
MRRRIIALVGIAAALSLTVTGSLLADGGKGKKKTPKAAKTITVPGNAVFPEGIAAKGEWIYTGSSADGTVYRAPRRGTLAVQLAAPGVDGRTAALGMKIDRKGHLLVAGGATGKVFVLDRATGATLGVFSNTGVYGPGGPTFLNDITIAKNGDAFITDSFAAVIYRIPAAALAAPTMAGVLEGWLTLAGSPIVYQDGFNLNGIVANKKYLLTVQTNTGKLFRIKIKSKQIGEITVRGTNLTGGDGLVLNDEQLYVVHTGVVDILKLKSSLRSAKLKKTITDPSFDSPTTAALHKGRLYIVNSQFGRPTTGPNVAGAPFTISVLKPDGKH